MPFKLDRPKQCKNCPWRKDADLSKIPHYYSIQHGNLNKTIQTQPVEEQIKKPQLGTVMLCHHTKTSEIKGACIGWIHNQINNNNIGLRVLMLSCENRAAIRIDGEQLKTFEDALPENRT